MIGVMPLVELQYVRVLHGRRLDPMGSISSGARASPTARARRPGIGPASQVCHRRFAFGLVPRRPCSCKCGHITPAHRFPFEQRS